MKESFKFRYVNEIAGTFVLAAVALLVVGIYVSGKAQGWFEEKVVLSTQLTMEQGTFGLQKGGEVQVMGEPAGRVLQVAAISDDAIKVTFQVSGSFLRFVRRTSVVHVKKKFAVAGDAYIEVTVGNRKSAPVKKGDMLKFEPEADIMKMVTDSLEQLRKSLLPLLDSTKDILVHVDGIVKSVDEGKGAAGRLIGDQEMGNTVKQTLVDVQHTTAQLPGIVSNATAITADVQGMTHSLSDKVEHVDELVQQTTETLKETERLIQGTQKIWPLRNHIPQPGATELIPVGESVSREGGMP